MTRRPPASSRRSATSSACSTHSRVRTSRCRSRFRPRNRNFTPSVAAPHSTAISGCRSAVARASWSKTRTTSRTCSTSTSTTSCRRSRCRRTPCTSTRTGAGPCPTSAGVRTSRPTASRRPSRTSTATTTMSCSRRRVAATTWAATSRFATSRAPGGARATT